MSVLLTASKFGPTQRALKEKIEKMRAAKKSEKSRMLRMAELEELRRQMGPLPDQNDDIRVWTFILEDKAHAVVFYVASLDLFVDRVKHRGVSHYTGCGAVFEFDFYGYEAFINSSVTRDTGHRARVQHILYIDGEQVPILGE